MLNPFFPEYRMVNSAVIIVAIALGQSLGATIDMVGKSKVTAKDLANSEDKPDGECKYFHNL